MTKHEEDPASRWYTGVVRDDSPVFHDGVAGAKLREVEALPKPAPSQAVGSTLNVVPWHIKQDRERMAEHERNSTVPVSAGGMDDDDERWQAEEDAEPDKAETLVQADDEQRAYRMRVSDKRVNAYRVNEGLRQHNLELIGSVTRLEERLADATVRAYEPPDTLPGVAFAAVEGLVAVGKRWWRG